MFRNRRDGQAQPADISKSNWTRAPSPKRGQPLGKNGKTLQFPQKWKHITDSSTLTTCSTEKLAKRNYSFTLVELPSELLGRSLVFIIFMIGISQLFHPLG
jgi:hypothetical protein